MTPLLAWLIGGGGWFVLCCLGIGLFAILGAGAGALKTPVGESAFPRAISGAVMGVMAAVALFVVAGVLLLVGGLALTLFLNRPVVVNPPPVVVPLPGGGNVPGGPTSLPTPMGPGSTESNCPAASRAVKPSAQALARLEQGEILQLNISRFAPSDVAHSGGDMESNFLISLAPGVQWAEIRYDGAGMYYPLGIQYATQDCQLYVETVLRDQNYPAAMTGVPNIFTYYHPFEVISKNDYPDIVYSIRWQDANGVHEWPSADGSSTSSSAQPTAQSVQPTVEALPQPIDVPGDKPQTINLVAGYAIVHTACEGCPAGTENVRLVKVDAPVTVINPEGNATLFPGNWNEGLLKARACGESTKFPNDRPSWLDVPGVTVITLSCN